MNLDFNTILSFGLIISSTIFLGLATFYTISQIEERIKRKGDKK